MKNGIIIGNDGKGNLLLSNEDGLFESHDNGKTWKQWIPEIVDFAPVTHAKWETKPEPYRFTYDCSHCGGNSTKSNYCPNCGAKMDKE